MNQVRAGGLGYAFGGDTARDGEANVCTLLDPDNEGSQCDDGAVSWVHVMETTLMNKSGIIGWLLPTWDAQPNQRQQVGAASQDRQQQPRNEQVALLLTQTWAYMFSRRNLIGTDVMKYNGFEIADIVNPKALLCKTNNLLSSMQTHVDVQEEAVRLVLLCAP
jgi:hypothetical protein